MWSATGSTRPRSSWCATLPFIERMDLALAVADLAVGRSGGSVAELAACRIPAILVPYPYATEGHQAANARELEELGAADGGR